MIIVEQLECKGGGGDGGDGTNTFISQGTILSAGRENMSCQTPCY